MKRFTSLFSALALLFTALPALSQGSGPTQYRVDNINALLQITLFGADAKVTAWVGGASARDDGLGGMFFYDGNSSAATNVYAVFKPVNNNGRWWKLPTSVAYQTAAVTVGDDSTYAWKLLRGAGATNFLGFGADNNIAYIQTFNSKNLHINNIGNSTVLNATTGNVGIGTGSPGGKLTVQGTSDAVQLIVRGFSSQGNNLADFKNSADAALLSVNASGGLDRAATVAGDLALNNLGANSITFATGGAEKARINAAGNLVFATAQSVTTTTGALGLSTGGGNGNVALTFNGTGGLTVGGGAAHRAIYSAASELDFGSIAANTAIDLTITVAGAGTNSTVVASRADGAMTGNISLSGWVSATNTVTVRASNPTVGAIDPLTGSYRVTVFQY